MRRGYLLLLLSCRPDDKTSTPDTSTPDTSTPDCPGDDPSRYPGAEEICEDGVVQDCESTEAEAQALCSWSGVRSLASATTKLVGENEEDQAGSSVSFAGDVNGDGRADLMISAPTESSGGERAGAVYVVLSPSGSPASLSSAHGKLLGADIEGEIGAAMASVGDVDADGLDDLLIGSYLHEAGGELAGAVWLILGPASGELSLADVDTKLLGEHETDHAGAAVSGAGDMDADGHADLLIGASSWSARSSSVGAAYVVLGPVSGELSLSEAHATLYGEFDASGTGGAVRSAGDTDGDGQDDLAIGAPGVELEGRNAGAVYLVLGPVSGEFDLADADATLTSEMIEAGTGNILSGGEDVNADGLDDLLIGAPTLGAEGSYVGAAYLLHGPLSGEASLSAADAKVMGAMEYACAGDSVSLEGDTNADGHADLFIGGWQDEASENRAGAAWLFLGPTTGAHDVGEADLTLTGEASSDYAGGSVSLAGDADADGLADLLVGASHHDGGGEDAGAAYLLLSPSY